MTRDRRAMVVVAMVVGASALTAGALVRASQGRQGAATARPLPRMDTPLVVCGADGSLPAPIAPSRETVALAGDSRGFMPCPAGPHAPSHREVRERAALAAAASSADPELRRRAAAAYGRLADPAAVALLKDGALADGALIALLSDPDSRVRREAASAIGDALAGARPEPRNAGSPSAAGPNDIAHGRAALDVRLAKESDADVAAVILETIGRLRYPDDAARNAAEAVLVAASRGEAGRMLGAAKGLEALIRQSPKRPIGVEARSRLREMAVSADAPVRVRRLALLALAAARDDHDLTLVAAGLDGDWQVRRLVALRIDFNRETHRATGARLAQDRVFQVRYEMVGAMARHAATSQQCLPLVAMFDDPEPTVALRAIDLLPDSCPDKRDIVGRLVQWAGEIGRPDSHVRWHRPAHAYQALARIGPDVARGVSEAAEAHPAWQVRAAAAAVSATLKDADRLERLAGDREPNVRTAALDGLRRMASPVAARAAVAALESDDYQLLRAAAITLRGARAADREPAIKALFGALFRVSARLSDTSRDPRVAILERLEELLPADRALEVLPFTGDFDRAVREVATRIITTKAGKTPLPDDLRERYPYQPGRADLAGLPSVATIQMEGGGTITLELLGAEAPLTVARFAELARLGYYDDLTFHRVVPNFVIQGGSPGANEYVGAPRYMRDEVGTVPHLRGAVGISTRGRDTGDAQIFIDLIDLPRLDHDYTVFARVMSGMEVVDRILEGARIARVTVK